MKEQLWSPIWGWYWEGEEEEKRLQSIVRAKQGLEELREMDKKMEKLALLITEAQLLACRYNVRGGGTENPVLSG